MRTPLCRAGLAAAIVALLAGCSSGHTHGSADKVGGSSAPPASLRLAYVSWSTGGPDAFLLRRFADRVDTLSHGSLRVHVVDTNYRAPNEEALVARAVRAGRFGLGWIASGGWDNVGVSTFRALQTPFLITGYGVMDAVARSPVAAQMLGGLRPYGVVGLALVPSTLLHPSLHLPAKAPLTGPSSYRGVRFLVMRWPTTDTLLSALGGRPAFTVATGGPGALKPLLDYTTAGEEVITANVVLSGRFNTLFANSKALAGLSATQRHALERAAHDLIGQAIRLTPTQQSAVPSQCESGALALASTEDLAALATAARPVTQRLAQDARTRAYITRIRAMKAAIPADRAVSVPPRCLMR